MRIAVVAGEASGDALGAALIRALASRWDGLEFYGIAGPRMVAEGARSLYPMERLSVRGYVEVLKSLREILAIRRGLARTLRDDPPDLFIGIDAPDFNLGLEAKLKASGIPTVHYVSPSVWAWRPERIATIGRSVDLMLAMFPFEIALYAKARIPASYVGHPLADAMPLEPHRAEARAQLRLGSSTVPVALLPGSRMSELELHADLFIDTAAELHRRRPELRFFVPLATRETREYFETRLHVKKAAELPIKILFGHAHLALYSAEAAIVASGTATLEAALARCPMVITYRLSPLTYRMVMRKALLPYFGLPNILAGEFIV
ncbi:MAG: lipid-A-disaccharide synthase, partial [Usitatibacter sp.]